MSIRLMIADDESITRAGVAGMLAGSEIEVAWQASCSRQTIEVALTGDPDVVLLDLRLPDEDGFSALSKLKSQCPAIPVIVFTASDDLADMVKAHCLGADGFVTKGASREELIGSLRKAASGKRVWTRHQLRRVNCKAVKSGSTPQDGIPLTQREREILRKMAEGEVNEDIATAFGIDVETVKQHVKHILRKIGVEDRTQAAIWAVRCSLL